MEIWKIEGEGFRLIRADKAALDPAFDGQLMPDACYIVLHTKRSGKAGGTGALLQHHLFFWIGKDSKPGKRDFTTFMTLELDQSLCRPGSRMGATTQHKETQGHESGEMLALFPAGISCMLDDEQGNGVSGASSARVKLFHVKGRKNVHVTQVAAHHTSLNNGDVFILGDGKDLFQWNGHEASELEKIKGLEVIRKLWEVGGSAGAIHIVDEGDDAGDQLFWKALGCDGTQPPSIKDATDDDEHERKVSSQARLYQLSDEDQQGKIVVKQLRKTDAVEMMTRADLHSEDAYVLDTGANGTGIWAWVGRLASKDERKYAIYYANEFAKKINTQVAATSVTRINEGSEPALFKQYFKSWVDSADGKAKKGFDDAKTYNARKRRGSIALPDDGRGETTIWRASKAKGLEQLNTKKHGRFYAQHTYVVQYKYKNADGRDAQILYMWYGKQAAAAQSTTAAKHLRQLDTASQETAVQAHVFQGMEPTYFCMLFRAQGLILYRHIVSLQGNRGQRLFHVQGTNPDNVRAMQVAPRASSLNSGDCFIFILSPDKLYLWFGYGCSKEEREFTLRIYKAIDQVNPNAVPEIVMEGREDKVMEGREQLAEQSGNEFWNAFTHSKESYGDEVVAMSREARLFHCSDAKGHFAVEELFNFDQTDLVQEDVMLLDTHSEIFIWIGKDSNALERKKALEVARTYMNDDPSGRKAGETVLLIVRQSYEPRTFTNHFEKWDPDFTMSNKSYEENKSVLLTESRASAGQGSARRSRFKKTGQPEDELSDEQFELLFKMSRRKFSELPTWKKNGITQKSRRVKDSNGRSVPQPSSNVSAASPAATEGGFPIQVRSQTIEEEPIRLDSADSRHSDGRDSMASFANTTSF